MIFITFFFEDFFEVGNSDRIVKQPKIRKMYGKSILNSIIRLVQKITFNCEVRSNWQLLFEQELFLAL
jgi:hypothetical protein